MLAKQYQLSNQTRWERRGTWHEWKSSGKHSGLWYENQGARGQQKDLSYWKIISKWMLTKQNWCGLDSSGSEFGPAARPLWRCNESGFQIIRVMSWLHEQLRDSAPKTSLDNSKSNASWMLHYEYISETSFKRQSAWQAVLDLYLDLMAVTIAAIQLVICVDMYCCCKHVCERQTYRVT